jgi:uncharacterized SAM-binding protein YcdF (DUF218 family)
LQDFRAVPGLDQSLASPPRKAVNLAPLAQGHYALIVKRAVTFTAVGLLFCFAKRHAATSSMGLAVLKNKNRRASLSTALREQEVAPSVISTKQERRTSAA